MSLKNVHLTEAKYCSICSGQLGKVIATHEILDRFEVAAGINKKNYSRSWLSCTICKSSTNIVNSSEVMRASQLSTSYYEFDFSKGGIGEKFTYIVSMPENLSDNSLRVGRVIKFIDEWRGIPPLSGRELKVLDVGAGTGVFLAKLLQSKSLNVSGFLATAIEPDILAATHLRGLNSFEVIQDQFDPTKITQTYDLVTLNKVLEHIAQPKEFLVNVMKVLDTKGGILYIEVPSVLAFGKKPLSDNTFGSLHCHLYSLGGLTLLIESIGLCVLSAGQVHEPSGKISCFVFACLDDTFTDYLNRTSYANNYC